MDELRHKRDYSLVGADSAAAVANGLAAAEWYHTDVPRQVMKDLMQRSDGPAIRDTILWLGLMVVFAALGVYFWGSWLCVPFFLAYGVLYGSASDSRWHEAGHGTAFKTGWMNRAVLNGAALARALIEGNGGCRRRGEAQGQQGFLVNAHGLGFPGKIKT